MGKRGMTPLQAAKVRRENGIEETNLHRHRVKRGYSQRELSIKSGVAQKTIQCYEQQTRRIEGAKLETLCNLAGALNCKIEDILEEQAVIQKYKSVK